MLMFFENIYYSGIIYGNRIITYKLHIGLIWQWLVLSPDRHVDNLVVRLIPNLNSGQIVHAYGSHISFTLAIMDV